MQMLQMSLAGYICQRTIASLAKGGLQSAGGPFCGRKRIEKLWQEFFSDPSQWWDNRPEKVNTRYPDFKHKKTHQGLWIIDSLNPPWVEAELNAVTPGVIQVNIFSWNKRLSRCVKAGEYRKTMELFQQLKHEGVSPDNFTFVPVLNACSSLQALEQGRDLHLQIIEAGHESDVYVGSCLVDMYAKCGSIQDAERVFKKMSSRDVVSWNALILGYVKCGLGQKALDLSRQMQQEGVDPDSVTFVGILNACASLGALEEGRRIHQQVIRSRFRFNVFIGNSLVDMYTKCGSVEDARTVFNKIPMRDVVSWNSMIMGYVNCGQGEKALELFEQMKGEGVEPSPVTFVGLLNACASALAIEEGRHLHEQIIHRGCESNVFVASSLLNMYAKCGSMGDARRVFNKLQTRDIVSWNAIIQGYVNCGQGLQALEVYQQMQLQGVDPDTVTFMGVLSACASTAALEEGRLVHERIVQSSRECDVFVVSSLINMYAKCGSIKDARRVFDNVPTLDMVPWTAMLGGYAMHGLAEEAIEHFEQMCNKGVQVDEVALVTLLSACSHGGLVDEGLHYFSSMTEAFIVSPAEEHHACVVDLLGRAGRVHEAEDLIKRMVCQPNFSVWMSLLSACRVLGNLKMAEWVANHVLELDPASASGHVLLASAYADGCEWQSTATVHKMRLQGGKHESGGALDICRVPSQPAGI